MGRSGMEVWGSTSVSLPLQLLLLGVLLAEQTAGGAVVTVGVPAIEPLLLTLLL